MSRVALVGLVLGCALVSCRNGMQTKEQVRSDLIEYLSGKVGLDMKALDVDVTKVTFAHNQAHATVSFHEKNNPSIESGMVMQYTLEPKDGHWVVTGRADSQGHGFGATATNQNLPPGHPPVSESSQQLPPGHPPVEHMNVPSAAPAGESQGQTK